MLFLDMLCAFSEFKTNLAKNVRRKAYPRPVQLLSLQSLKTFGTINKKTPYDDIMVWTNRDCCNLRLRVNALFQRQKTYIASPNKKPVS
jgi:hypothetical protein